MRALLYPQTHLREDLAEVLLRVVEVPILLRPAEYPPRGVARKLAGEGRVHFLYPPPLGEKLSVFLDLVSGYEEWGRLMRSPENVALFKAAPETLEESVSDIKRALLGDSSRREDPVLAARVRLALAERLDHYLEELDKELHELEEKSRFLSRMIVGDTTGVRFPEWVTEIREPGWELPALRERLAAWKTLLPLLPELPDTLVVDQPLLLEEWRDLSPEEVTVRPLGKNLRLREIFYPLSPRELLALPHSPPPQSRGKTRVLFLERI